MSEWCFCTFRNTTGISSKFIGTYARRLIQLQRLWSSPLGQGKLKSQWFSASCSANHSNAASRPGPQRCLRVKYSTEEQGPGGCCRTDHGCFTLTRLSQVWEHLDISKYPQTWLNSAHLMWRDHDCGCGEQTVRGEGKKFRSSWLPCILTCSKVVGFFLPILF